jgi:hypothetical protein
MSPVKKIWCIVLLAAVGSFLAGSMADRSFHRYMHGFFDKLDIAFKDTTHYEVVFLGNSTVHFGINPHYVDSITGLNTFNLGYGGANIESISAMFYGYLEVHPKPQAIVLSLESSTVMAQNDRANYFLFFNYVQRISIRHYLDDKGYDAGLVNIFPFLKYSFMDEYNRSSIIKSFYSKPVLEDAIIYKGFVNNNQNVFGPDAMDTTDGAMHAYSLPDSASVATLYSLLDYCKNEQIKVLFVFPPRIYQTKDGYVSGTDHPDTLAANTALRFQMPYQRFNVRGLFNLNEFSDKTHLNKNGTIHYSICIGQSIDSILRIDHPGHLIEL